MDWYPLWNSLRIAVLSTVPVYFLGIYFAQRTVRTNRVLRSLLDALFTLPLVLSPTVCGYLLLQIFGTSHPVGAFLVQVGLPFAKSWYGGVFCAMLVSFPLMYRTARLSFETYNRSLTHAAQTLGMSNRSIFWRIQMPCCRSGVLTGTILAFARALGEYGATSMALEYEAGRTATLSTTVFQLWQSGNAAGTLHWVLVDLLISALVLVLVSLLERRTVSWEDYT